MSDDRKKSRGASRKPKQKRHTSRGYKSDLEKLFDSDGKVPERFQEMMKDLGPEEGSEEFERRAAVEILKQTKGFREFVKAVNVYQKTDFGLPDDEEVLGRMLDHPRESLVRDVLNHLLERHERGELKGSASMKARLKTVKTVSDDPRIHEMADTLLEAI